MGFSIFSHYPNPVYEMAKEGRFWFDHDYHARNDDKILELRAEFGAEGYGVFWMLIETMADSENAAIKLSLVGGLAHGYGVSKNRLSDIINFCVSIGLLIDEEGFISSKRIKNHKIYRKEISEKNTENIKKYWKEKKEKKDTTVLGSNTTGIRPAYETDTHNMTYTEHIDDKVSEMMTEKEFLDFSKKMKSDRLFTEPLFTAGVKPEYLDKWIIHYHIHIVGEGNIRKDYNEYRRHFKNWLKKQDYCNPPPAISTEKKINGTSAPYIKHESEVDFDKYRKK